MTLNEFNSLRKGDIIFIPENTIDEGYYTAKWLVAGMYSVISNDSTNLEDEETEVVIKHLFGLYDDNTTTSIYPKIGDKIENIQLIVQK